MNTALTIGTQIVIFALIAYSVAIITEQRKKTTTNLVLIFITAGVILDISATTFMILGSSNSPFTLHGLLGYSSLAAMLIDAFLLWMHRFRNGIEKETGRGLHLFSRFAYIWWILAFLTGGFIAMSKYM